MFLNSKPADCYFIEINKLPNKCQEVIENNGEYIID